MSSENEASRSCDHFSVISSRLACQNVCGGKKHEICRQGAYVVHRNAKNCKRESEKSGYKKYKSGNRSCKTCKMLLSSLSSSWLLTYGSLSPSRNLITASHLSFRKTHTHTHTGPFLQRVKF